MYEHDPLVLSYVHLRNFPREKDALHILKKVASQVKPIMRARGWKVPELAEFFPDQENLLGLNVNRGQKILLRLRYPRDRSLFLPVEQITDTMLHELSHIVHGPHDARFHALWNQLRDEHEGLVMKGYTGEGFLSEGHRLGGGRQLPMHEARRLARAAAERRQNLGAGSGRKLGGAGLLPGQDIRKVIVDAVERRNKTLQGCGNTNHNENEIRAISETATRNGFRTQAEEDAANEAAIAQALWELVQEDEKRKYGSAYVPPTPEHPSGSGGGAVVSSSAAYPSGGGGPVSLPTPDPGSSSAAPQPRTAAERRPLSPEPMSGWTCQICTLHNPDNYLCCDACGVERPENATKKIAGRTSKRPRTTIDLTTSPARPSRAEKEPAASLVRPPATWDCSFCGTTMERQWWTCSTCGKMKEDSK
ncbi:uncharacterized protein E0L32_003358 [Thyridium curvatum]|uniref:WLM-domain-containing protein n=1 Tax=Thyridium curvatum TaxID=1093900 RepID=A0A507BKJ9_9PEZI|nr:uncharacterized protein E0L32_003358 [Thyridium curvatum]TPX17240.1 hypothetical protein E0L32_003358 [Thyridium curvatum]